jgi:hypothetical protein
MERQIMDTIGSCHIHLYLADRILVGTDLLSVAKSKPALCTYLLGYSAFHPMGRSNATGHKIIFYKK